MPTARRRWTEATSFHLARTTKRRPKPRLQDGQNARAADPDCRLRKGNLSGQLTKLEEAGLIVRWKEIMHRKMRTTLRLTARGTHRSRHPVSCLIDPRTLPEVLKVASELAGSYHVAD